MGVGAGSSLRRRSGLTATACRRGQCPGPEGPGQRSERIASSPRAGGETRRCAEPALGDGWGLPEAADATAAFHFWRAMKHGQEIPAEVGARPGTRRRAREARSRRGLTAFEWRDLQPLKRRHGLTDSITSSTSSGGILSHPAVR
jgi:hypothetical protein